MDIPKTLMDAIRYYSNEQVCIDIVAMMRWPEGEPVCPKCGTAEGKRKHYWLKTQKRWKCYACRKQFSVKVDSVFEDSPIGLDKWLVALWMLCNCKNGVSSHEISRELGIAQQHAWHLLHRLRLALGESVECKMGGGGPVEVDETIVGPDPLKMHADKKQARYGALYARPKVPVMGMLDRELRQVRAKVVPNVKRETLQNAILEQIEKGSTV